MSQAAFNLEAKPKFTPASEYSDFERRELAIALNSKKRGDAVLAIFHENKKANPDAAKIDSLNQQTDNLLVEQYEIYSGNIATQMKVIDTYHHEQFEI